MKSEYRRELNHSYLVLHPEHSVNLESYPVKMLTAHSISALLPCHVQALDENNRFCYEVTSRLSMESAFRNRSLTKKELRLVFGGILKVFEELRECLISPATLLIEPEFLFLDPEEKHLYFCCLPGYEGDWKKSLVSLLEYLLPRIHHGDSEAVNLGYGMYRTVMEAEFSLETMKQVLYGQREPLFRKQHEEIPSAEDPIEQEFWNDALQEESDLQNTQVFQKEKYSKTANLFLLLIPEGIAVSALLLISIGKFYGYLPYLSLELLLGVWLILVGGSLLGAAVWKRKRRAVVPEAVTKNDPPDDRLDVLENKIPSIQREAEETTQPGLFQGYPSLEEDCEPTELMFPIRKSSQASLIPENPLEDEILLNRNLTIVGKLPHAVDVHLAEPTISRMHARIRREAGEFFLSDLNSRNGTSVNGEWLNEGEEWLLKEGDQVAFAESVYRFSLNV